MSASGPVCPHCGGTLRRLTRHERFRDGRIEPVEPPGAECEDCRYLALDAADPAVPHPLSPSAAWRVRRLAHRTASVAVAERIADSVLGVERVPGRCGGRPTVAGSRLTVETVVGRVLGDDPDAVILENHPALDARLLADIRARTGELLPEFPALAAPAPDDEAATD